MTTRYKQPYSHRRGCGRCSAADPNLPHSEGYGSGGLIGSTACKIRNTASLGSFLSSRVAEFFHSMLYEIILLQLSNQLVV